MAASLKLYFDFLSQPSRSIYIILKLSGTPFEPVLVSLQNGENYSDKYEKVNRFQKVPCIVEGDFKLAESIAILRYLHETKRVSESLYPTNAKGRARVDEFLDWQHLAIRKESFLYFRFKWMEPFLTGKPTPEGKLEKFRRAFERQLEIIENIWLDSTKFVTGDKMTVADIFGVCEIQQTKMADYNVGRKYPKTATWIESVRRQTNPAFDEAHKEVYKFSQFPKDAKL